MAKIGRNLVGEMVFEFNAIVEGKSVRGIVFEESANFGSDTFGFFVTGFGDTNKTRSPIMEDEEGSFIAPKRTNSIAFPVTNPHFFINNGWAVFNPNTLRNHLAFGF